MTDVAKIDASECDFPEINMDTNDQGQPFMVDVLSDPKHSRFGPNKKYEDLLYIVNHFRIATLSHGERERASLGLKGRRALYNEVAQAYQIALTLLHSSNKQHLEALIEECEMSNQANALERRKIRNSWIWVCTLLYGSWQEKTDGKDTFLEFQRNRSAEKYGNVMRHLHDNKVKANGAAMYIETFKFQDTVAGKPVTYSALLACEKADRAKHAKPKSKEVIAQQLKHEKGFIQRGESTDSDDVFYAIKPDDLPESVKYGQATFKVFGSRLLIVGYDAWEEAQYKKHVIARGRKIKKDEDKVRAQEDKKRDATADNARSVSANVQVDDSVHTLLESGVSPEEIAAAMKKAAADLLAKKAAA